MKILCLYPMDETTLFLNPIFDFLSNMVSFKGIRFESNEKDVELAIDAIKTCDEDTIIIFLGHGASHCLYKGDNTPFIGNEKIHLLANKRIFLLACRSAEFIDSNKNIEFKSSIGFGNMLTDWSEVLVERDADANAYPDISIEVIELYRSKLVNSIQCAWSRTITSQKDFEYLYLQIKLFINKEITELLTKKNIPNYIALANLLYETKTEMSLQH